jgi:hypothetical protein
VKKSSDQVLGRTHQALRSKISHHQGLQRVFLPIKLWEEPIKLFGTKSCHQTLEANPSSSTLGSIQSLQAFRLGYLLQIVGVRDFIGVALSLSLSLSLFL